MEHPENDDLYKGLKVNKGVADVPTVNPYLKKRIQRKEYTPAEFVEGILKGNITILSQAVTLVESSKYEHQQMAQEIIEKCLPHAGKSVRIGITGVPGAGKSTSIDAFGMHLIGQGRKLAVLAIDPSSERSKGSILGDKTRMEALSREKNAFIRPSPSAGSLGGVARKTRETIVLCEAAGFDTVFVETVGVSEKKDSTQRIYACRICRRYPERKHYDPQPGGNTGGKLQIRTPANGTGNYRKMPAACRKVCPYRHHRSTGSR